MNCSGPSSVFCDNVSEKQFKAIQIPQMDEEEEIQEVACEALW